MHGRSGRSLSERRELPRPRALFLWPGWQRVVEFVREKFPFDDASSYDSEPFVVVSRVGAQAPEGLIHVTARCLTDHALRLFNNDATIESVAQLIVECTRVHR